MQVRKHNYSDISLTLAIISRYNQKVDISLTHLLNSLRYMNTHEAVTIRITNLCKERGITPNALSYISGVPQSTIKSILNAESKNPGIVTIKKLCDGFEITLEQFFNDKIFDDLEQEIK